MVAAAILAGGAARRLGGVTKSLISVDGRRIIDRQLDVLRPLFDAIVIVANDPAPFAGLDVPIVPDRHPGCGPLGGVDAALASFPPAVLAVLIVAGDMPFLHPAVLRALRDAPPAPVVAPLLATGPEPLCARYARSFAPIVAQALATQALALHPLLLAHATFLDEPTLRLLDPNLRTFTNLNSPQDLLEPRARVADDSA